MYETSLHANSFLIFSEEADPFINSVCSYVCSFIRINKSHVCILSNTGHWIRMTGCFDG